MALAQTILSAYAESWKAAHDEAMACHDLEDALVVSNQLFQLISALDEDWHTDILAGRDAHKAEDEERLFGLYRKWAESGTKVLGLIDTMELRGYTVRGADEYRRNLKEARGVLAPDGEFFAGEALERLKAEAFDEHRGGRTVELEQLGR